MTTSDAELARAAGIPVDVMRAIRAIESGNNERAVRFEPHVFLRDTSPVCRDRPSGNRCTTAEILSNAIYTPAQVPFTPDPVRRVSLRSSETNRAAFERARALNEDAAIRATSWGLYQVLGGHLLRTHPRNPVAAFDADPRNVANEMLVSWFQSRPPAQRAAMERDIPALANMYNGSVRWGQRLAEELGGNSSSGGMLIPVAIAAAGAVWYFSRSPRGGLRGTPVPARRKRPR